MHTLHCALKRAERIMHDGDPEPVALLTALMLCIGGLWIAVPVGTSAALPQTDLEVIVGCLFGVVGGGRMVCVLLRKPVIGTWFGLGTSLCWLWLALSIIMVSAGRNVSWLWYLSLSIASMWSWNRLLINPIRRKGKGERGEL